MYAHYVYVRAQLGSKQSIGLSVNRLIVQKRPTPQSQAQVPSECQRILKIESEANLLVRGGSMMTNVMPVRVVYVSHRHPLEILLAYEP
jgi:hypothetical protein